MNIRKLFCCRTALIAVPVALVVFFCQLQEKNKVTLAGATDREKFAGRLDNSGVESTAVRTVSSNKRNAELTDSPDRRIRNILTEDLTSQQKLDLLVPYFDELVKSYGLETTINKFLPLVKRQDHRQLLISSCFGMAQESLVTLVDLADKLEGKNERENALVGLKFRALTGRGFLVSDFDSRLMAKSELSTVFKVAFLEEFSSDSFNSSKPQAIRELLPSILNRLEEKINGSEIPANFKKNILLTLADKVPFAVWQGALDSSLSDSNTLNGIFSKMVKEDPSLAAGFLTKASSTLEADLSLKLAREIFSRSPDEAKMLENSKNEGVSAAFVEKLIKDGDIVEAKARMESIQFSDGNISKMLGGRVWSAENKLVAEAASVNPAEVVRGMAKGTSEFESLYLPTALNAWIKEDGEAAAQWVEREGVNLPPETRQYVAIAYAREAATQGKIELADQWAALIVDEERKVRVFKHIDGKR